MKDNIVSRVASSLLNRRAAKMSVDLNFENEEAGTRITLSSDGSIKAYVGGNRVEWEPVLSETQIGAIASEDLSELSAVGSEVLAEFTGVVKTAKASGKSLRVASEAPYTDKDVKEHEIDKKRTGEPGLDVQENLLKNKGE